MAMGTSHPLLGADASSFVYPTLQPSWSLDSSFASEEREQPPSRTTHSQLQFDQLLIAKQHLTQRLREKDARKRVASCEAQIPAQWTSPYGSQLTLPQPFDAPQASPRAQLERDWLEAGRV